MALVLCSIFAAGLLAGCGGDDAGGAGANDAVAGSPAAPDTDGVAMAPLGDGDGDNTVPATACTGAPGDPHNTVTVRVDQKAPGAVLVLEGSARRYELWIRRKLPRALSVTMTEMGGNVPGVDITTTPSAPGNRWAVLTFDIPDCPASNGYVIAHQADMKSRAGTLDTIGHRVSGWVQGASGYILAQGIVAVDSTGVLPPDTAPPAP
jgi:hypothetical protein